MYHELGHASHFERVRFSDFWAEYVHHIVSNGGYGDGNDNTSDLVSLGESWADMFWHVFADNQYGLNHSGFGADLPGSNPGRFIFRLEEQQFNQASPNPQLWIPWGLFYDVVDDNTFNPLGVADFVVDPVFDFSIEDCYLQLDQFVRSPTALEARLSAILPPSISLNDLNVLFDEYGY